MSTTTQFLEECSSCTQCGTVCPFLEKYGSPEEIIANKPQLAFLCTNCTGCDKRCPLELSPSAALFETKQRLISEGRVPEKAARALKGAKSFAHRGHAAPFLRYDTHRVAFWPGCSLAGTSPETVEATRALLASLLNEEVGLVLDCCFDPLYQMGDLGPVQEACDRIRERISEAGIKSLIVGCVNCRKVFGRHMEAVNVTHIMEVLPEDILKTVPDEDLYFHHPCPHYHVKGVGDKTRNVLARALADELDEQLIPACCGLGGSLNNQDPELALKFTERVTMAAYGASIVTACMGCKNAFLKKGTPTYHILELITGVEPKTKPVGLARKWANRLLMAKGK
ncbi:(Fe-S)-binding protein [bacterium]|nr:(Fe-S)-binding protein [bacterium]